MNKVDPTSYKASVVPQTQSDSSTGSTVSLVEGQRASTRYLFSMLDPYPTHRVDVTVLFGRYLPELGIRSDIVGVTPLQHSPPPWPPGRLFLTIATSRVGIILKSITAEFGLLRLARQTYAGIVVRDKPILSVIGLLAARLNSLPYYYWQSFPMSEFWLAMGLEASSRNSLLRRAVALFRGALGYWVLYKIVLPRADHVFAQSEIMKQQLSAKGIDPARITAVPMGVDPAIVKAADQMGPIARQPGTRAVYLGSLDRMRQPEVMVDAAILVRQRVPDFELIVVGSAEDPADRTFLEDHVKNTGSEQFVKLMGRMPQLDALRIAKSAQVGLSPIPRSPLFDVASPTKTVEYMALGIPVVGNDQPEQAQILNESQAGVCSPLTAQGFADGILYCLEDPGRAKEMGERGRRYANDRRDYATIAKLVASSFEAARLKFFDARKR